MAGGGGMRELKSIRSRKAPTATALDRSDPASLRQLKRTKLVAGGVLVASLATLIIAKLLERHNPGFGFLAAFAEAAMIGGLADWYAVVVLFRRPFGLPIPHTAIIPANHRRIAERLGGFIETHFLAPEPVGAKLRQVDFAAAASDWLCDPERSDGLARFLLRLLPEALTAAEDSGLRGFLAWQLVDQIKAVELAPLAAELMTTFTEDRRHQRLLDELLFALNRLMTDPVALDAIRQKIRAELPTLLNLYRADRFLLKKIATSAFTFLEEVRTDENHPLRNEFDRFVATFIQKIASSPEYAHKLETLKRDLLADQRVADFAQDVWVSFRRFLERSVRDPNSVLHAHLRGLLVESGRKLADDTRLRAHINCGMVAVLESFVRDHKGGVSIFIADQVKAWDMDQLVRLIEINVGRDLQFIRFNGAIVGGLAGLALYTGELLLRLA
jgi:uncharacterized membrane-anchored protein YjiN (DUF445 family)